MKTIDHTKTVIQHLLKESFFLTLKTFHLCCVLGLYGPFCHHALKLDPICFVCNISLNISFISINLTASDLGILPRYKKQKKN